MEKSGIETKSIVFYSVILIALIITICPFFTGFIDFYTMTSLVFMEIMAAFFYKDRKNVKRESKIFFLRRTQKGKRFLINLTQRFPRFWKIVGSVAVVVGLVSSIIFFYYLLLSVQLLATTDIPREGTGILLPTPTSEPVFGRGFIAIPFWYWIIIISCLIVAHEGMHAIMGSLAKVKLKSLGWGLLLILPLAFVEPDEKQVTKKKFWEQMRFFAAGSFGNFILAGVCFLVFFYGFAVFFTNVGIGNYAIITGEGYPAEQANLTGIIISIDNYTVRDRFDLANALYEVGPNKKITITTKLGTSPDAEIKKFTLTTIAHPDANESNNLSEAGYIGIGFFQTRFGLIPPETEDVKPEFHGWKNSINFFKWLFFWMFLINLFVGGFNLLPLTVLDGEKMWRLIARRLSPKYGDKIMNGISLLTFFIIISLFYFVIFT